MGVPKFFRYISERYPCLQEKLKEYQIPEFDNLYLDMNGIIHNCSHPNDADVAFRITEETIFKNIFHYIEILFRIIQPQKLFFMAIDGVAPRAKINQQRGRRFRSAKEAEVLEAKARAKGEEIPKEARFDSNCITPGTEFMSKLNEQLRYFVNCKITTDKVWQKCKIILSGSEVPGEGEHKIMDYIRYMKSQEDYNENTRHCLYGLDADLIMLGLCSHEPHFSLLREEVKFGKVQKKILTPEEQNFCLLHLSLMREYLELEFTPVKDKLPFKFDIEKIIDDWILMGFLVGNDFIPHLPNLHIENDALPILYNVYMEILPQLDGYINESGFLNLERFEKFMERLGQLDLEQFDETFMDLKYFEAKTGGGKKNVEDDFGSPKKEMKKEIANMLLEFDDDDDDDTEDEMLIEFQQHKRDYYMNKMEYPTVDSETMRSQAEGYVRAIQWNLHYYYNGCCSWSWFYPHHYAPYISDIKNFKNLKLEFELGEPFLPFQQLLAVLPAASKELLPQAYHKLMTQESSPIIRYYPVDFKTDLNGKRQEWEAVVLIPIINEKSLLDAMEPYNSKLSSSEKKRNTHGPMCEFTYSEKSVGTVEAPEYFPSILSHAEMKLIRREEILVPLHKLVKGLCKRVRLSTYFPGFPTLQHIPHTASLEKAKVKVFEQASRRENMILTVMPQKTPPIQAVAQQILGKTIFIGWPHLREALVISVSDASKKISPANVQNKVGDGPAPCNVEEMDDKLVPYWNMQRKSISENYKTRFGIEVGEINILVHAKLIVGRQYVYTTQGKMTLEKQWNDVAMPFAYQVIVHDISVHAPDYVQFKSIADVFVPKVNCFMLGHPYYGSMGEICDPSIDVKTSRVRVSMRHVIEPSLDRIQQMQADTKLRYVPGAQACQRLGISSHLLSRVTGTIFVLLSDDLMDTVNTAKQNIGLNLKFNKRNEEVPGYTKRDTNGLWLYSTKAIEFVHSYMEKFPQLFENLEKSLGSNDMFLKSEVFPVDGDRQVLAVAEWLKDKFKSLGITSRQCGTEQVEPEVVREIEKEVDNYLLAQKSLSKLTTMQVKPHLLYKAGLNSGYLAPDPQAFHRLFDRIVSVRESFTVPYGFKGTIVGCSKGENSMENMYEVVFDKPFAGGLVINGCSPSRGYRLALTDFINISYGIRVENKNSNKPTTVPSPLCWRQQSASAQKISNSPDLKNTPNKYFPDPSYQANKSGHQNKQQMNPIPQQQHNPQIMQQSPMQYGNQQQQQMIGNQNKIPPFQWPVSNPYQDIQNRGFYPQQNLQACKAPPPQAQIQQQKPDPSEFESLWKELHIQKPPQVQQPNYTIAKREPPSTSTLSNTNAQDPSNFLKAILKIDESSHSKAPSASPANKPPAFPQPPQTQSMDTPPLVQQMFDHARQTEMKQIDNKYGSLLLSHFQKLGVGFPRYNYLNQQKNNTVCGQIILPDSRTFHGEFCADFAQAAESVAKKVYHELKLDSYQYNTARMNVNQPPQSQIQQQWFNPRPNLVRPSIPNMPPILPAAFPSAPMPQIPMPKWRMPQQTNVQVPNPTGSCPPQPTNIPPPLMSLRTCPPAAQHINNIVKPQSNWFQQQQPKNNLDKPAVMKTEPNSAGNSTCAPSFVPLQAQKKNRNAESAKQQNTAGKGPKAKEMTEPKIKQSQPKEKSNKLPNKKESGPESASSNNSGQKSQRAANQRRSRIAAKFLADPSTTTPNGGNRA